MKKFKITLLSLSGMALLLYIFFHMNICPYEQYYLENGRCNLLSHQNTLFQPLFLLSLSLFITSIFTFFISDKIFKKWLVFTGIWFFISALLIYLTPVHAGGPLGANPDKEDVSILMSTPFVIISFCMFIIMTWKERKN